MIDYLGIAWAAGLFEGEGSFTIQRNEYRLGVRMTLSSTDLDVVEKFWSIAQCGNINGPYWHDKSTKPQWTWSCGAAADVMRLGGLFRPHLGARRLAKLDECLTAYKEQPPKHHYNLDKTHCPRGHEYLGDNLLWAEGRRRYNLLWAEGRRRCRACEQAHSEQLTTRFGTL